MHSTIEQILKGNSNILEYYKIALSKWEDILEKSKDLDTKDLGEVLTNEQFWFENYCGGRDLGQEVMVISGIVQFYSTSSGFDINKKKALRIYHAFMKSYCSLEVKGTAQEIAESYYLLED